MKNFTQNTTRIPFIPNARVSLPFLLLVISTFTAAQQKVIRLYDSAAPGSETWNWTEGETTKNPANTKIVYNVTNPTLTLFSPAPAVRNGCAVIIVPGGGGRVLMFEKEGITTAKELVKQGITVFILKYRLTQTKTDDPWQEMMAALRDSAARGRGPSPVGLMARADLVAAVRHVRQHADTYKIDKNRVGLIGFSAGAVMSMNIIYNADLDAVPDFAAINYGVMRTVQKAPFREKVPPLFIASAADDQLAPASNSIELFNEWYTAKHAVELHIYLKGRSDMKSAPPHGLNGTPANTWINRFVEWLDTQGFLRRTK